MTNIDEIIDRLNDYPVPTGGVYIAHAHRILTEFKQAVQAECGQELGEVHYATATGLYSLSDALDLGYNSTNSTAVYICKTK